MVLQLLDALACPVCKGELIFVKDQNELYCKFDRLSYPIQDGVPILIIERAKRAEEN